MPDFKTLITSDEHYPELLKKIFDPPKELYIKGDINALNNRCLSIVGTRRATQYGLNFARKLAGDLTRYGFTVVSGLAEGIDTQAHIGALDAGGKTIAVFGCGIDVIFPAGNQELAGRIERSGALVSEYAPGFQGTKWTFPRRNRIISGLSSGVVVIEGGYESGAMITAKLALDEGREVFAVPGNVELEQSKGPHWLIKQGAKLVESVDDILDEFNIPSAGSPALKRELDVSQLSIDEMSVIKMMSMEPLHIDVISSKSGMDAAKVLGVLSMLEIKDMIKQMPGKYFVIC
jgi:DNA processing protein